MVISILHVYLRIFFFRFIIMNSLESWKKPHETPTEWRVRRMFLKKNFDKRQPERLECLSNCFTNVKLYGVSYPSKVMEEIEVLGEGIVEEATTFHQYDK
uniref:XRN2-binding (XTBD) domain-containing protein n=1 Tax=Trichobilharzia regenti TaxID=157069 RepID=A0AA85KAD6_TRIRE|nr:unnamed protein product [Trichobilharzia regenti]